MIDPPHDDPPTPDPDEGQDAGSFTAQTALAKAKSVAGLDRFRETVILAADTVCVGSGGSLLGKPADRDELLAMLRGFVNGTHEVVSGVALLVISGSGEVSHAESWADAAEVVWGDLSEAILEAYADSSLWRGKSGGYNLRERVEAGWPITVSGDETTVMGLPMQRLWPKLSALPLTEAAL